MARVFLGIASSEYEDNEHLPLLEGAIVDGGNIQNALLNDALGKYDSDISRLMISPTLSEVQDAIKELLFSDEAIDCLTLYFAGHGISHMGAYYLCLKDTYVDKLSATALPLGHIFNVINDAQPLQTNIIIDACEAGGLASDLASLIKPEVFGGANSPSVSLFASCGRDQAAEEDDSGGYATQHLLKYINGEISIDTRWPFLDLVQIGRNVSVDLDKDEYEQTPIVWGLSLTGISTFSQNPHYNAATDSAAMTIDIHTFVSSDLGLVQDEKEKIWLQYLNITRTGATPELLNLLIKSVRSLKEKGMESAKIGSFLLGTAEGLSVRVAERKDAFSEIEILASCGAAFLPIAEDKNVAQSFYVLLDRILQSASNVFEMLESDLDDPNALLSGSSGLNDLYILPLRLSKILGWLALIQRIQILLDTPPILSNERIRVILEKLSEHYVSAFVCVSEAQAPYLMMFSQMKEIVEQDEEFLLPMRCYVSDFIEHEGKITISDASGEGVLNYLVSRNTGDYRGIVDVLAQPSELLSVLLDAVSSAGMDDDIDQYLIKLDHMPFNFFIADDVTTFSDERIENGSNITMQIGSDVGDGVFNLQDFRKNFEDVCMPRIHASVENIKQETLISMVFASFIIPDRMPWIAKKEVSSEK